MTTGWLLPVLGLIQGVTEFLPVSSSGHLRLLETLLGKDGFSSPLFLEVALHAATLGAVAWCYRMELRSMAESLPLWLRTLSGRLGNSGARPRAQEGDGSWPAWIDAIVLGSIPTAMIGVTLKKAGVERIGVDGVCAALYATALIDLSIHRILLSRRPEARDDEAAPLQDSCAPPPLRAALVVGIVQGLAVFPGISRSGSTILAGLALGMRPAQAARFSFLLSLPAVFGATLLVGWDLIGGATPAPPAGMLPWLLAAMLTAFVSGILAIRSLLNLLEEGRFLGFSIYCALLASVTLWLLR